MDSRRNRILIDGILSLPTSTAFNDQLRIMHREWAYRVHKQNDLEMDLQQLYIEVPPLIAYQMHRERMFTYGDALLEIQIENNQMMRHKA